MYANYTAVIKATLLIMLYDKKYSLVFIGLFFPLPYVIERTCISFPEIILRQLQSQHTDI